MANDNDSRSNDKGSWYSKGEKHGETCAVVLLCVGAVSGAAITEEASLAVMGDKGSTCGSILGLLPITGLAAGDRSQGGGE